MLKKKCPRDHIPVNFRRETTLQGVRKCFNNPHWWSPTFWCRNYRLFHPLWIPLRLSFCKMLNLAEQFCFMRCSYVRERGNPYDIFSQNAHEKFIKKLSWNKDNSWASWNKKQLWKTRHVAVRFWLRWIEGLVLEGWPEQWGGRYRKLAYFQRIIRGDVLCHLCRDKACEDGWLFQLNWIVFFFKKSSSLIYA